MSIKISLNQHFVIYVGNNIGKILKINKKSTTINFKNILA